jgi:hypothetical protein
MNWNGHDIVTDNFGYPPVFDLFVPIGINFDGVRYYFEVQVAGNVRGQDLFFGTSFEQTRKYWYSTEKNSLLTDNESTQDG